MNLQEERVIDKNWHLYQPQRSIPWGSLTPPHLALFFQEPARYLCTYKINCRGWTSEWKFQKPYHIFLSLNSHVINTPIGSLFLKFKIIGINVPLIVLIKLLLPAYAFWLIINKYNQTRSCLLCNVILTSIKCVKVKQ